MKNIKKIILMLSVILVTLVTSIGTTTVMAASDDTVATIGENSYSTLDEAIAAVTDGQVIKLESDVSYSKTLTINKSGISFTINMNSHTITFKKKAYLNVKKGSLTINGNGTIKHGKSSGTIIKVKKNASLSLQSGSYSGMIVNAGTMSIKNGTFLSTYKKTDEKIALITNTGTMSIKGGEFNGNINSTIYNKGKMKISGGNFTDSDSFYYKNDYGCMVNNDTSKGKLQVTGGTFTSYDIVFRNGLNSKKSSITIKDGTFTSTGAMAIRNYAKMTIFKGTFSTGDFEGLIYSHGGQVTVKGGTFKTGWTIAETYDSGKVTITGGTFSTTTDNTDIAMLISKGGKINVTGGKFTGMNTVFVNGKNYSIGKKVSYSTKYYDEDEVNQ